MREPARYIRRMDAERELMRLHIATLFTEDDRGRLVRVNEPSAAPAPRFFLGRTPRAREWRVRHDVDQRTVDELAALCSDPLAGVDDLAPPTFPTPFEPVLARSGPVQKVWAGPVFHAGSAFRLVPGAVAVTPDTTDILHPHLAPWVESVPNELPMFVAIVDGAAVAVCATVRRTPHAVQAGVETVPDFRGKGYATIAAAAWIDAVRRSGLTPLYSTSWQNTASRALARRLGLTQFGADLHFT